MPPTPRRPALPRARLAALALAVTTCAPPLQSGGVVVVAAGADARLRMLCRWRHGEVNAADLCPGEPAAAP